MPVHWVWSASQSRCPRKRQQARGSVRKEINLTWQTASSPSCLGLRSSGMNEASQVDRTLLLMDDDTVFLPRLAAAMEARGYEVKQAPDVATGLTLVEQGPPAYAVVDLRLLDGTGLDVIARLRELRPTSRSIVLTGYGNIATAVGAVKSGADDYLANPLTPMKSTWCCANWRASPSIDRSTSCRLLRSDGSISRASSRPMNAISPRPRAV